MPEPEPVTGEPFQIRLPSASDVNTGESPEGVKAICCALLIGLVRRLNSGVVSVLVNPHKWTLSTWTVPE